MQSMVSVLKLAQDSNRAALKNKLDEILASTDKEDIKAAIGEYYDTFEDGEANSIATDKLISVLSGCDCDKAKEVLAEKEFCLKSHSGFLVATAGLGFTILDTADLTMFWLQIEMSMYLYLIQKFILIQADRLQRLQILVLLHNLLLLVRDVKKKDLAAIAMSYGYIYVAQIAMGADMNQCVKAIQVAAGKATMVHH